MMAWCVTNHLKLTSTYRKQARKNSQDFLGNTMYYHMDKKDRKTMLGVEAKPLQNSTTLELGDHLQEDFKTWLKEKASSDCNERRGTTRKTCTVPYG